MEECKTEVEVRRWAKINGYTGEGIEKIVEKIVVMPQIVQVLKYIH